CSPWRCIVPWSWIGAPSVLKACKANTAARGGGYCTSLRSRRTSCQNTVCGGVRVWSAKNTCPPRTVARSICTPGEDCSGTAGSEGGGGGGGGPFGVGGGGRGRKR